MLGDQRSLRHSSDRGPMILYSFQAIFAYDLAADHAQHSVKLTLLLLIPCRSFR